MVLGHFARFEFAGGVIDIGDGDPLGCGSFLLPLDQSQQFGFKAIVLVVMAGLVILVNYVP